MFTGIITDIGTITAATPREAGVRLRVATHYDVERIALGASIALSGACMTVTDKGTDASGEHWFAVDVSAESLARTTMGHWRAGTRVNLERALALGEELGGHLVTGHVDGLATLEHITPHGEAVEWVLRAPEALSRFIAEKGSVTLDGVSLTVNRVNDAQFHLMLIPHTLSATTLRERRVGDALHLEIDLIARYLARLLEKK